MYQARPYLYSNPTSSSSFPPPSPLQSLSLLLLVLHFLKREFETVFVHRFSNATMPFHNIFKNCGHYWFLAGVFIAYFTYSPYSPAAGDFDSKFTLPGVVLFMIGELGNLYTHLVLRSLRTPGTRERNIPRGFSFNWVTCPNYMWEILAWAGIILVTKSWATLVFTIVGAVQMFLWAKKKERAYRKDFGDKYKRKRFVLLPGLA
jgi:very-long-chain enoyl-CoA reductase